MFNIKRWISVKMKYGILVVTGYTLTSCTMGTLNCL